MSRVRIWLLLLSTPDGIPTRIPGDTQVMQPWKQLPEEMLSQALVAAPKLQMEEQDLTGTRILP